MPAEDRTGAPTEKRKRGAESIVRGTEFEAQCGKRREQSAGSNTPSRGLS